MTRAVVFLVAPGPLVLLDDAAVVLVERKAGGHTGLLVRAIAQAIHVDARFVLDDERGPLQRFEIPDRPRVDLVAVRIGVRRQLELGPRHTQKAQRVAAGLHARFFGRDDIVGNGRNAAGIFGVRT